MSEAERLVNVEKVNIIAGTYSSPRAMTASEVAEKYKKIYYEMGAAADELTLRKMKYFFRLQVKGSSYGIMGADYSAQVLAPAMNKKPGDLKVVSCYEDSIWGSTINKAFAEQAKKLGMNVSEAVSYNYKAVDFSGMITKFKMFNPDIVYGVNYAPDFMILWRQMKQLDLNMKAYLGNGTLIHEDLPKALGSDIDYVFNIQGVGLQNFNLESISKRTRDFLSEIQRRHQKKYGMPMPTENIPPAYEYWVLLDQVLPMAGSDNPDAVREALFKLDIPLKDSLLGFGIKFGGPDSPEPGQNIRAVPAVMQWMDKKLWTVYPSELATMKVRPIMPTWKERGK
jgi:branched-chain amino acid transport system substrate-binding protein